ncbi:MAG: glycosyltransferase family 39 protein [Chloroflexi bacterium]|nr:glycosyltransferase family 39 protein [Chloroflexota bacterium]MCL5075044.1 glycosyltransferase family 39 protein [Chloroflexota bacterium]
MNEGIKKVEASSQGTSSLAKRDWLWLIALVFIIVLSFGLHLYHIEAQSLWWDETLSYHRAHSDIGYILSNKIVIDNVVTIDQHPPLYFLLLHFCLKLFGKSEFAIRFLSVITTILTIPMLYTLGRSLFDRWVGFMAAFLAALSPYYLWYGQEARPYALFGLLSALSLYLVFKVVTRDGPGYYLSYVIIVVLMLLTHYLAALVVLAELFYFIAYAFLKRRWKVLWAVTALGILAIPFVPTALYAIRAFLALPGPALEVNLQDMLRDLAVSFSFGITVDQFQVLPYAAILGVLMLAAFWDLASSAKRSGALLLLFGLIVPIVLLYIFSRYKVVYNTRYAVFLSSPYYLLLSLGVVRLGRWKAILAAATLVYFLTISGYGTYDYLFVHNNTKQNFRAAVGYIVEHSLPGDAVVLNDSKIYTAFEYYDKAHLPWYGVPRQGTQAVPETIWRDIERIGNQHERIWLLQAMAKSIDPLGLTKKTLENHYAKTDERIFTGESYAIEVYLYNTSPYVVQSLPSGANPVAVNYDNRLNLLGYRLDSIRGAPDRLSLILFWQAKSAPLASYSVVSSLTDSEGYAWAIADAEPFNGFYPTSRWEAGEIVADRREIQITPGAPPGIYTLQVGVHQVGSERRLVIRGNDGRPPGEFAALGKQYIGSTFSIAEAKAAVLGQRWQADFGGKIILAGSDWPVGKIKPGDRLNIRLFWQSKQGGLADYTVRLYLVSMSGRTELEQSTPISRVYASTRWRPGEIVGAHYALTIPAQVKSGEYHLLISLSPATSQRLLPVHQGWWPFARNRLVLGDISVSDIPRTYTVPPGLFLVAARLDDQAELLGYSVDDGWQVAEATKGTVPEIRAGDPLAKHLKVTLQWRALREMDIGYTVFLQLLDAQGVLVAQDDGLPQGGARPTTGWVEGEIVADTHELVNADWLAPGKYTLIAGMYDSSTSERLRTADGHDYILLGEVVLPSTKR